MATNKETRLSSYLFPYLLIIGLMCILVSPLSAIITEEPVDDIPTTNSIALLDEIIVDIDEVISANIKLYLPETNQTALKPEVNIKGVNRFLMPVFVNGTKVNVRADGRFLLDYPLRELGDNLLIFSFLTPDLKVAQERRVVKRFYAPKDVNIYPNSEPFIHMMNSSLIYAPDFERRLSSSFTRSDLAYFIATIKQANVENDVLEISDVDSDEWVAPYAKYVLDNNYMILFPNGKFEPHRQVTFFEYIMTIVRAFNLNTDLNNYVVSFEGLPSHHWAIKYLKAVHKEAFIPDQERYSLDKKLTIGDFIELIYPHKLVQDFLAPLHEFDTTQELPQEKQNAIAKAILDEVTIQSHALASSQHFYLEEPKNDEVYLTPSFALKGKIQPIQEFKVNTSTVTPDRFGDFSLVLPLTLGVNTFNISVFDKTSTLNIYYIPSYQDLEGHWIAKTAAKLRFINVFPKNETFNPSDKINRDEFANILNTTFDLTTTGSMTIDPIDVSLENPYREAILNTVSKNIFMLDEQNEFHPQRKITKAESIVGIIRSLKLDPKYQNIDTSEITLKYKDLSNTHWAANDVKLAVYLGLLSNGPYFYPKKVINRSECAAMLIRLPIVQDKFKEVIKGSEPHATPTN